MTTGTADAPIGAAVAPGPEVMARAHAVARAGRFPALDGLRALAVLSVMATHVGFQTGENFRGTIGALLSRGDVGVTIFFLLSGFLLYTPFVRGHLAGGPVPATKTFLRNRALRILPAYWVVLAVVLPTLDRSVSDLPKVVTHVLLLQVYPRGHLVGGLTQTWSLAVEASFYLILPLLALLVAPARRHVRTPHEQLKVEAVLLAAMVTISLAWTVIVRHDVVDQHVGPLWLPQYLDWFALGMGFAVLRSWHDRSGRGLVLDQLGDAGGSCWIVAALLFWLTTTPLGGPRGLDPPTTWEAVIKHLLYGLAAGALLVPALFGTDDTSFVRRLLTSRPARHLGRISYGIFLWHLIALDLVFRLTPLNPFTGHALLVAALVFPLSVAMAELSLRVVEQPALNWKRSALPPC